MKKITKLMLLWLCCTASMALLSCSNDDETTNQIDQQTRNEYIAAVRGNYTGKLYFVNDTITTTRYEEKIDSVTNLSVQFRASSDTIMTISPVPCRLLSKSIQKEGLKEALENASDLTLTGNYMFFNPASGNIITYYMNLHNLSLKLNYGGEDHEVVFVFYNYYSYGEYATTTSRTYLQTYVGAVYEDGKLLVDFTPYTSSLTNNMLFWVNASKSII